MKHRVASPKVNRLRAEYCGSPAVVGIPRPRLSWTVENADEWTQRSYEMRSGAERVERESPDSLFVSWPFAPLESRDRRSLRVRATSTDGRETPWSDELVVEAALLAVSDWRAAFVGPSPNGAPQQDERCRFLRHEFLVDRTVASARLYVTALGVYEPYLNGSAVGHEVLAPNWTSYHHRLRYQTFDVGDRIEQRTNVLGAIVGDGWYRGRLVAGRIYAGESNIFGSQLAVLAQLEIVYVDGSSQIVVSDESWRAKTGPILASSIYDGERYDARLELHGWAEPGYDDSDWHPVEIVEHPLQTLVVPTDPPIRRIEEHAPAAVLTSPSGKLIVDFGQNLAGRLRISVSGRAGDAVTIKHAEILQDGELALEPLRTAGAEDTYILRGGGVETWEPRFTYHGFRYAQIDGWPGEFDPASVTAVVLHTDFERTGWFECSHPLVNRLHENAVWSMRGNFLGLPTDCPARDERLGWTGDIQVFAPAASFLYDVSGLLVSWLADLAADQWLDGKVPNFAPDTLARFPPVDVSGWVATALTAPLAGWGDAAVIVPWVLYQRFGDVSVLAGQWQSMRNWVNYVEQLVGPTRLWDKGIQLGDWLDPFAPPDRPQYGLTPTALVATAYLARSADLVARTAEILGLEGDAAHYRELAEDVRSAFRAGFFDDVGNVVTPSATAHAFVLEFSLAQTDEERGRAGRRLRQIVAASGHRLGAGFLGAAVICDALCESGDADDAYRLLLQTKCPSWLYPVTMGATTIWERLDGLLPDGRLNTPELKSTSFNHFAFGAVVDWLHRTVAGLEPAEPAYRRIRFRPRPGRDLTHASASHITPYGLASISWYLADARLHVEAEVPANTSAEVDLPDGSEPFEVQSGAHRWTVELQVTSADAAGLPRDFERY